MFLLLLLLISRPDHLNARIQPHEEQNLLPPSSAANQQLTILSKIAPILGESAIIDKETNRIYWQGGRQSLIQSTVGHSYLSKQEGILRHIRATLLSCILWISLIRFLAQWLLKQSILSNKSTVPGGIWKSGRVRQVALKTTRLMLIIVSFLPKFSSIFIIMTSILYLIESYICSTRRFLDNALLSPDEVEDYMEGLRKQKPTIKWEIRCFHYERKKWLSVLLLLGLWNFFSSFFKNVDNNSTAGDKRLRRSFASKKIVTHKSSQNYIFDSWEDQTVAGIWKKAKGTSLTSPFTKISLSKVLLFTDSKTKTDYFSQQSKFVNNFSKTDEFAELSTIIKGMLFLLTSLLL